MWLVAALATLFAYLPDLFELLMVIQYSETHAFVAVIRNYLLDFPLALKAIALAVELINFIIGVFILLLVLGFSSTTLQAWTYYVGLANVLYNAFLFIVPSLITYIDYFGI